MKKILLICIIFATAVISSCTPVTKTGHSLYDMENYTTTPAVAPVNYVAGNREKIVMSIDGEKSLNITESMYNFTISMCKTIVLYSYQQTTDIPEFWAYSYSDESDSSVKNFGGYQLNVAKSLMKQKFAASLLFRQLGLELPAETTEKIDASITALKEKTFGTTSKSFEETLARFGVSVEEYRTLKIFDYEYEKVVAYYFHPESGVRAGDLLSYYNENFVRAKHILLSTTDITDAAQLAEIEEKAQDILARSQSGKFESLLEMSEDPGTSANPDGYTFTYGEMVAEFESVCFDMEVDSIRLVRTDYGFHVIKRYPLLESVINDDSSTQYKYIQSALIPNVLEEIMTKIVDNTSESLLTFANVDIMFDCFDLLG